MRLLLTRTRSTETLAISQQARVTAREYHALKREDPMAARDMRGLYMLELKGLEIADPDEYLPAVTNEEIEAWKVAISQPPPSPPRDFIQYKDTPPSIQRQMEEESGFTPASDEERKEWQESQKKPAPKPASSAPAK